MTVSELVAEILEEQAGDLPEPDTVEGRIRKNTERITMLKRAVIELRRETETTARICTDNVHNSGDLYEKELPDNRKLNREELERLGLVPPKS